MSADVIHWRRRRTVRWQSLSLAARGAIEGIVAACDERGELLLPKQGLPALAAVLGRPWAEVEPAVLEAIESGKIEYNAEARRLRDPSHAGRVHGARADDELRARVLQLEADLAREREAARKRKRRSTGSPQSEPLFGRLGTFTNVRPTSADISRTFAEEPAAKGEHAPPSVRHDSSSPDPDPDLKKGRIRIQDARARVVHDAEATPLEVIDLAELKRPDLPEYEVRELWRKFAKKNPTHVSEADALAHFGTWLAKQDRARGPNAPKSAEDDSPTERPRAAPKPAQESLGAKLGLPPLARGHGKPEDVVEALRRLEGDAPEPRAMSA